MPIFEWKCDDCGNVDEYLIRAKEPSEFIMCTRCTAPSRRKQFSRVNHMFTGFLREDFYDEWERNTPGDYAKERGEKKTVGVGI